MRGTTAAFLILVAGAALLALAEEVSATTTCQGGAGNPTVANTCQGFTHVSTATGGVSSARCFSWGAVNVAKTCTTSGLTPANEAWQMNAGSCQTLYYFDTVAAGVAPAAPNKVTIQVLSDNAGSTIKVFQSAADEPANGTPFTFCATSDGNAGSPARAGTYRLNIRAVKDNAVGGVGNYDVQSGSATGAISFDRGAVMGREVIASIARNAYPSGSTFAYGAAGDESITLTATFAQPNADAGVECMTTGILDSATLLIGAGGAVVDVDATTTLAQSFVVDGTFPLANGPYVTAYGLSCSSTLTGMTWATLAATGHGANIVRASDSLAYDSTAFNINPGIAFDSDGAGTYATADETAILKIGSSGGAVVSIVNRGETVYSEFYIFNARSEQLTRTLTIGREDATPTTCASAPVAPTAGKYSFTGTISTSLCLATNDATGSARYYRATATDQSHRSGEVHRVSTLLYPDSHIQVASILVPDDYPTEDAGEYLNYLVQGDGLGGDMSDTIRQWCKAENIRHEDLDTSGSAVTRSIKDPTATTRATGTTDTGSDGWTPASQNLLASTPLGTTWTAVCSVAFNSNTGSDTETFTVQTPAGGGGDTYQADPLKVFTSPDIINPGETTLIAISASFLDGTARLGAASEIFVTVYDPDGNLEVNSQNPTEVAFGTYTYEFTVPDSSEDFGGWLVLINTTDGADAIGTSNTFFLELDGDLEPVTAFETATTTTGLEFLALIAIVVVAIIVWSRSTDFLLRMAMGVLCLMPALIWLRLAIVSNGPVVASLNATLALLAGVVGGYMIVRQGIDKFQEG